MRTLYYGDNLEVLRKYVKDETVDLCYIDPPFNSKRNYNQIYNNVGTEDRAQAQAFTDTWEWDERANSGFTELLENAEGRFTAQTVDLINGLHPVLKKSSLLAYLISMTLRINEIHRVLKPEGTFYLHCDPTASHYLKLVVDAVFIPRGGSFRNEIVWVYRGAGYPKTDFGRRHDTIFRYSKGKTVTFNLDAVREEYAATTKERFEHYIGNKRGKNDYGEQALNPLGKHPDDWWQIQPIAPSAKERLGYPTQKPEKLLEKIILASSNEGDVVLDAYCGCGTTVYEAEVLKRSWIGIDITYQSIALILRRLEPLTRLESLRSEVTPSVAVNGIPKDMEAAQALALKKDDRLRKEFEKWAVLTYSENRAVINDQKGADGGIDGTAYFSCGKDKNAKMVFQVKSGHVGRGDIAKLNSDRQRESAELGVLLTLQEPTKPMREEANAVGTYFHELMGRSYPRIQIVTIAEMIEQSKRMDIPLSSEVLKQPRAVEREYKTGRLPDVE